MSYLLNIYRKIVPENVRRVCNESFQNLKIAYVNRRAMERKRYGNLNKDKTFYVIRTDSKQLWGIGTSCSMVLNNIKYAVEKGWIPVVDYKNHYLLPIQDEVNRGKENAWEYYFEQLADYSLEEVYKSRNVILGPIWGQPCGSLSWSNVANLYDEKYNIYFELCSKWIRIKPEIIEEAERIYEAFVSGKENKKILGINMRAGLYWGEKMKDMDEGIYGFHNHPKGLDIDEYIEMTYKLMDEFDCEYIYISCEDRYYFERMKREFTDKCLYIDRELQHFFDMDGNPVSVIQNMEEFETETRNVGKVKHESDYIMEIYFLSKCDSLFAVHGGGYMLACLFNNKKYDNVYIVNKGYIECSYV